MHSNPVRPPATAAATPPARKADWRQGWILAISGFLPIMAILALAPTLPTLLAHFRDVPNAFLMVPLLITAPSACIALLAPGAGAIADRFGRRPLLLWSMAFYAAGGLIPFAADNFWMVVAGRFIIGIGEAGVLTVVNTLLADYFEEQARHRWLMIQGVVGSVLGVATIASSGFLAAIGWQWPFLVYAVAIPILLASIAFLFEPESRRKAEASAHAGLAEVPFPYMIAAMVVAVTVLMSTIYYVQVINFSLVLKDLGVTDPEKISVLMAIPSIGVPLGAVLFKLTTRFGANAQIALVLLCYAIGLSGIGLTPDYRVALGFAFVQQVGSGAIVPVLVSWAQSRFSFRHRGRGMGWWVSSFFIAQFLSPAVVNVVRAAVGSLQGAFLAFGLISAACAVGALLLRFRAPGTPRPQTES